MHRSTAILAGIVLACSTALAAPNDPVISGGQFFGFVPESRDAARIQVGIAKQVTSLADAIATCHRNGVRALVKGDPSTLAACVFKVHLRYDERADDTDGVPCIPPATQVAIGNQIALLGPMFDPILWCDGTTSLVPEGFGGGVEPDANVYRTESAVSKKLVDYGRDVSRCVQRAVLDLVDGDPSDLDACLAAARADADAAMRRGQLPRRIGNLEPDDCLKGEHDPAVLLSAIAEIVRATGTLVFCPSSPPVPD